MIERRERQEADQGATYEALANDSQRHRAHCTNSAARRRSARRRSARRRDRGRCLQTGVTERACGRERRCQSIGRGTRKTERERRRAQTKARGELGLDGLQQRALEIVIAAFE